MKKFIFLIFFLFFYITSFAQLDTIYLSSKSSEDFFIENQNIQFYKDKSNSLNLEQVRIVAYDSLFTNPNEWSIIEPFTNIWFKINLKSNAEEIEQWILAIPDFKVIDFYFLNENGKIDTVKAGTHVPLSKKQLKSGTQELASFIISPNETKTVYIKAQADFAIKIQNLIAIFLIQKYYDNVNIFNFLHGIFVGFLIMMVLYNISLYLMTKIKSYAYYSLYLFNTIVYILTLLLYIRNFFFPDMPVLASYLGYSINFVFIFYFFFMREFIESKNNHPKLDVQIKKVIIINLIFSLVLMVISIINYFIFALATILFIAGNGFVILILIMKFLVKGNNVLKIFSVGASFLFAGVFIALIGVLLGINKLYILIIFEMSIFFEVFVFSIGLSYKYKLANKEIHDTQLKLIEQYKTNEALHIKVNKELEEKVKERTLQMSKQNKEINTLYSEMHHRVKNNFATIIGILEIQIEKEKIPEIKNALKNTSSRLNSMALIHQLIHNKFSLTTIKAKDYIEHIADYMHDLMSGATKNKIVINCSEDIFFNVQTAVPIGVIINEALINSLKHAVTKNNNIICNINIEKEEDNILIKYFDNGTENIDINDLDKQNSIGLYLIKTMTRQLDGEMILDLKNGFAASFVLKNQD